MQICLTNYPQLGLLAWNRGGDDHIDAQDAFALYERNWRFIDEQTLSPNERQLIEQLTVQFGNGVMNV